MSQLQGAQQEEMNAQMQKQAAISGIFGSLGQIATGVGEAAPLYKKQGQQNSSDATGVNNGFNFSAPIDQGTTTGTGTNQGSPVQNQPAGFDWMWGNGQQF